MKKFAFIGGGSFGFTRNLVKDLLTFPAFKDAHIVLMDIDTERLDYIHQAVKKIIKAGNYPAKVTATTNRIEALKDADGVLCTILAGDVDVWQYDILIPKKYGVDINVGDTRGPSGIFRALRTIPVMLDICKDIDRYCPNAVFLNYTNPMAMLCRAMQLKYPHLKITGLCHSVQGTASMLADWIKAPADEITYKCAGVNHQAFYLEYKWNGKDAYPLIKEALKDPEIYKKELVRNNMYEHLDYYVTESSGHNSEYVAWYRKNPETLKKYCMDGTNWNPGHHGYILEEYMKRKDNWRDSIREWLDKDEVDLVRG
ncbi:MAG: alpha-glucosidase/alpha-galactosidase, partial [Clostridia bacterium]|nr:alpha-glucosidase/alpha-galactosidase [Clostridia bacterium]